MGLTDTPKKLEELLTEMAGRQGSLPVLRVLETVEEWVKVNHEQWEITDNAPQALALTYLLENELRVEEDPDCGLPSDPPQ